MFIRASTETKLFYRILQVLWVVVRSNYTTGVLLFEIVLLLCCAQNEQIMWFLYIGLMRVDTEEVHNVPPPMPLLHVSLLLDFTTAAAAEELRSRRQQHANLTAAAEAALQLGAKNGRD